MIRREAGQYAALAVFAAVAGAASAFFLSGPSEKQASAPALAGRLVREVTPLSVPDAVFADAEGKERRLSEWRGKPVILNLWATWCAPCAAEMPSLDRLQANIVDKGLAVIALSVDRGGLKQPAAFFAKQNIVHLKLYNDATGEAVTKLKAPGLPFTVLLNGKGQSVARLTGPAEWDSPEMTAHIEALLTAAGSPGGTPGEGRR